MLRANSMVCSTVLCLCCLLTMVSLATGRDDERPAMHVARCDDFAVNGRGDAEAWKKVEWTALNPRGEQGLDYRSQVKMLYSEKGVYVLMDGDDQKLNATFEHDFDDLWKEDVFEVFLWTDERYPVYFEYEISPLSRELPILIPNFEGQFLGWRPWNYEGDRLIQKAVSIRGGQPKSGADIEGWRAEFFIPYALLAPLKNVPPEPGTRWRANFYRMDYDGPAASAWDWSRVGPSFHEYEKFGTLIFD